MDGDHISQLVQLGSSKEGVQNVQNLARKVMSENGYGPTMHNACAATLSEFLNVSDIDVPITLGVTNLSRRIRERGWQRITVGHQRAGDVAVAKNDVHIFLVVQAVDNDEMVIADNQYPGPHSRLASGDPKRNHSPTAYFLRAAGVAFGLGPDRNVDFDTTPPDGRIFPQNDEDTNQLSEPFDDGGRPTK